MAKLVANSYGEALFELALEKNALDDMLQEVVCIQNVIEENADFRKFLSHPQISKEEKISVVEKVFKEKASNDIVGLLVMIVKKDRYNEIDAIFDYFVNKVKEHNHIGVARVTSAVELNDEQKKTLMDLVSKLSDYTIYIYNDLRIEDGILINNSEIISFPGDHEKNIEKHFKNNQR